MTEILREALAAISADKRVALATLVAASGSFPMSRRAKMLVLPDGTARGTIGGGSLEAEVLARAKEALERGGPPRISRFVLTEEQAEIDGLVCGGTVEILTEVLGPGPAGAVIASCLEVLDRREEAVLVTALGGEEGGGRKILVRRGGLMTGSLGDPSLDAAAAARAEPLLGADLVRIEETALLGQVVLETIHVVPTLVLFGGGHISLDVTRAAKIAGFRVVVLDDRPAFAGRDRHPDADDTRAAAYEECLAGIEVDARTYLVAVTRGHQHDETVIRQALRTKAGYIGMIGSRRKVELVKKRLASEGFGQEELDRLHAPVGLDIGADTPGEIAISIVAELVAVRRRGGSEISMKGSGRGSARAPAGRGGVGRGEPRRSR